MASVKSRIGWKRPREKENKYCRSVLLPPNSQQKIPKKQKKYSKKLKNIIMAPFQATIGWRRMRKEETKNYRFVPFIPDA